MTTIPGYVLLMRSSETASQDLAEQMSFAGIPVTLTRDGDGCCLFVPESYENRSKLFLEEYFNASSDSRKAERQKIFETNFLKPAPSFLSAAEKLKNRSNAAFLFIGMSVCLLIQAGIHVLRGDQSHFLAYLVTALPFLIFGIHTNRKAKELKKDMEAELAFTKKVTDWFFKSYSADSLDRMVFSAQAGISPEEMDLLRRDLIRDYILREFSIKDIPYLEFLTDEIFAVFYP